MAERERKTREAITRRRNASIGVGIVGIILLFGTGIGVALSPGNASLLLGVMVFGIALLVVAFLLVRPPPMTDVFRTPPAK